VYKRQPLCQCLLSNGAKIISTRRKVDIDTNETLMTTELNIMEHAISRTLKYEQDSLSLGHPSTINGRESEMVDIFLNHAKVKINDFPGGIYDLLTEKMMEIIVNQFNSANNPEFLEEWGDAKENVKQCFTQIYKVCLDHGFKPTKAMSITMDFGPISEHSSTLQVAGPGSRFGFNSEQPASSGGGVGAAADEDRAPTAPDPGSMGAGSGFSGAPSSVSIIKSRFGFNSEQPASSGGGVGAAANEVRTPTVPNPGSMGAGSGLSETPPSSVSIVNSSSERPTSKTGTCCTIM
jgi:hypothetical protein